MTELVVLVPGGPLPRTGGTLYNEALMAALRERGCTVHAVPLTASWPSPRPHELARLAPALARLPHGAPVLVDGLLWTGLTPFLTALTAAHPCTVLVHSPLFRETGLSPTARDRLQAAETYALSLAHQCIATGGPTLRDLAQSLGSVGVCVPPGTRAAPLSAATDPGALLCVATLTRRKGHDRLLTGLATVRDRSWHLTCAGSTTMDPTWAEAVRQQAADLGLADRVTLTGELGPVALEHAFQAAGTVVHAAHYEAFGMALAEAVARGLPVVSTPAGALEGPARDAAVLLPPNPDHTHWKAALDRALGPEHTRLRASARAVALPDWNAVAAELEAALAR